MKKYFVNYAQAVALKELGFDEKCFKYYRSDKEFCNFLNYEVIEFDDTKYITNSISTIMWCDKHCTAPLKAQVFDWFREKHGLWVSFGYDEDESEELYWYVDKILKYGIGRLFFHDLIEYNSYEEAESAAIDKLLEIIKEK
jgi:hypothetical protein